MVARLTPTKSLAKILSYNEKKVTQHRAELIHARNYLQPRETLNYADKLQRFQQLNELNSRSKVKMLHATLNFHPSERLTDSTLAAIADRYMECLNMSGQPYLVYRHEDANHPHVHVVSSLIRPDGSRINTNQMATRLSEPARKSIEKEFHLLTHQRRQRLVIASPDEVRKLSPEAGVPVTQSMDRVLAMVNDHYSFSNIHEYNAILRAYNLTAETGSPRSKTNRYRGIYYTALDDNGNKISPPVMASHLPSRPTLSRLETKCKQSSNTRSDNLVSIRQRIDWAVDRQPRDLRDFVSSLHDYGLEIVTQPINRRIAHDQIFVDHRTRTAVTGQSIGEAYSTAGLPQRIARQRRSGHREKGPEQSHKANELNANVPQLLSTVLQADPLERSWEYQHGMSHGQRRKT